MSILTLLDMICDDRPDAIAVAAGGLELSYAELRRRACGAAVVIQRSGASHCARLGAGSLAEPVGLFGAAAAGVPYAPLNFRLTADAINALIDRLLPALLVVDDAFIEVVAPREGLTLMTRAAFLEEAAAQACDEPLSWADPGEPAVLLFTSGTTGVPKAAILRHQNLVAYVTGSVEFAGAEPDEAGLVAVPPYHIAGVAALLSATFAGRKITILEGFSPQEWLDACGRQVVTHAFLVPTMLARIVADLEEGGAAPPLVRAISYGGGRMPEAVIRRAVALFPGAAFTNAYGLTETSSTVAVLTPDDHRAALAAPAESDIARRITSVGQPIPGIEVEVRDDDGRVLPAGTIGAIYLRGDQIAGEYRDSGSLLDADGWFNTRDHGYLDHGGYLHLEGRLDDVIVRGGENISPGEIERALTEHPAVDDAAAVAIPDDEWGEAVGAAIVLKLTGTASAGDLRAWVRDRLRSSRVPTLIQFRQSLPYNEMGKLVRRTVREEMIAEMAAQFLPTA
ncbi:class I adenylate-forming enzyme family protein [Sphingomonas sp.]|uniref:class I adenylate-forming enzyme family protein n=1 Tax=Sphingomonas sp. TaxID=28214 RepID=UPI003B0031F4